MLPFVLIVAVSLGAAPAAKKAARPKPPADAKAAVAGAGGKVLPWSSKALKQANEALEQGATSVRVGSRSEAEELFLGRFQGHGYRNVTGMSPKASKNLFGRKAGTYHWDEGEKAFPHGANHPQVHTHGGEVIRIYFP